ncbi:MAG: PQQ-binding-like beta-propeller repeat protein [Parvibaculum sp.]|nr:PQQ-binding-like beta-propeller repeat protein [Parvibaculum sp.]
MLTGPDAASPRVTRHRAFRFAVLGLAMVGIAGCDTVTGIFTSDDQTVLPGERLSVMELGAVLEVDPAVADMEIELPPARANADWPQPGGVPSNAMHHLEASGTFARAWSANAGSGSSGAARLVAVPVIVGERIYVLDARGNVRAMERQSGRTVWTVSLVPKNENAAEARGGGIAYDDGKIFVTTGFGNVHALDPAGGTELWVQAIGDPFRAAPTATDGRIFAVTADNQMICISQDSGEVLWRHRGIVESAGILTSTSPAVSGAVVIAPYSSGELVALRVENGTPVWSDSLTRTGNVTSLSELNDIAGRPVIDRNRVIAVSHSGRMVSIDLRTGERVWTRDIGSVQTPWVAGEYIFVVTTSQELLAISRRDGRIRWLSALPRYKNPEKRTGNIEWSGPILVGERLFLVSSDRDAITVSPYTGEIGETISLSGGALIPPVVAGGTVYVLTNNATLLALR